MIQVKLSKSQIFYFAKNLTATECKIYKLFFKICDLSRINII